jgi:hypothetical protein
VTFYITFHTTDIFHVVVATTTTTTTTTTSFLFFSSSRNLLQLPLLPYPHCLSSTSIFHPTYEFRQSLSVIVSSSHDFQSTGFISLNQMTVSPHTVPVCCCGPTLLLVCGAMSQRCHIFVGVWCNVTALPHLPTKHIS